MSLQCYNRGCGQKFDKEENTNESCRHHPGEPVFHDAYKGWACCNKKCTDFTEFLNIKGCTVSEHSNIKPPEPEKPSKDILDVEVIEVKPIVPSCLKRPTFDTPMVTLKPVVAQSLLADVKILREKLAAPAPPVSGQKTPSSGHGAVPHGTTCKNGGCGMTFDGEESDSTECRHHPGTPVFHEGLKFWSCCQRRTTDFTAFLAQAGCEVATHVWLKEEKTSDTIQCRWDHHQTGSNVVVSIYAKQYCPDKSVVQMNPIRLYANLVFLQPENVTFTLDVELKGIIDVVESSVNMFGTKVEIKMKKAEPGSWARLDIPREPKTKPNASEDKNVDNITPQIEAVDLSDL